MIYICQQFLPHPFLSAQFKEPFSYLTFIFENNFRIPNHESSVDEECCILLLYIFNFCVDHCKKSLDLKYSNFLRTVLGKRQENKIGKLDKTKLISIAFLPTDKDRSQLCNKISENIGTRSFVKSWFFYLIKVKDYKKYTIIISCSLLAKNHST